MGEGEGEKYCLLCNKVASEVLPQAQSAISCAVEGVEPGTSQMAKLINHQLAMLLGESQNWSLGARIEQEGSKGVWVSCSYGGEERAQVGSGGSKLRPCCYSGCCCCSKAPALPSDKVGEGARCSRSAIWDLASASWISTPMSSQPAGPISSTCHSQLDSCFLTLKLGGGARGEDRRGAQQ